MTHCRERSTTIAINRRLFAPLAMQNTASNNKQDPARRLDFYCHRSNGLSFRTEPRRIVSFVCTIHATASRIAHSHVNSGSELPKKNARSKVPKLAESQARQQTPTRVVGVSFRRWCNLIYFSVTTPVRQNEIHKFPLFNGLMLVSGVLDQPYFIFQNHTSHDSDPSCFRCLGRTIPRF